MKPLLVNGFRVFRPQMNFRHFLRFAPYLCFLCTLFVPHLPVNIIWTTHQRIWLRTRGSDLCRWADDAIQLSRWDKRRLWWGWRRFRRITRNFLRMAGRLPRKSGKPGRFRVFTVRVLRNYFVFPVIELNWDLNLKLAKGTSRNIPETIEKWFNFFNNSFSFLTTLARWRKSWNWWENLC